LSGSKRNISKVKKKVQWLSNDILVSSGIRSLKLPKKGSCTLLYHGIDDGKTERYNSKFISEHRLLQQLQWLKENTEIVSTEEIFKNDSVSSNFKVAISFDDGFLNNYKYVLPLIEKLNIPVTVFVTAINLKGEKFLWPDAMDLLAVNGPKHIEIQNVIFNKTGSGYENGDGVSLKSTAIKKGYDFAKEALDHLNYNKLELKKYANDLWEMMGDEEIKLMSKSKYVTIGSHGVTHDSFTEVSEIQLLEELSQSKKYLEELIDESVDQIAFPYGHFNSKVVDVCMKAGYRFQFAVEMDSKEVGDKRVQGRLGINPFISWANQVKAIGNGKY